MRSKILKVMIATATAASLIAGTGIMSVSAADKTKIRVYMGGENAELNANLVAAFNEQSETTEAELVTLTDGQTGYQMLTVMYNSNSAPNVFFLEAGDIANLEDKLIDISDMECLQYATEGSLNDVTYGDKVLGAPIKTQAYGLIYNKTAVEELLGADFDVTSIKTLADFEAACQKIEEQGVAPTVLSPYNWSLGNHYFNMIYSGQDDTEAFIEALKNGEADLANNEVYNSYMDSFDVLAKYNYYKENPLEDVADEAVKQSKTLYTQEAVFWFQGSWESTVIRQLDTENEYGFIPVPLTSEEENNYGKICSLLPGYYCVDGACATEEQQESAKEFIEYVTMSSDGQQYVADDGNIPAYTNFEKELEESLVKSAFDYITAGETFDMFTKYPADHFEKVGNLMQQYLIGELDRAGLATAVEEYWSSNK